VCLLRPNSVLVAGARPPTRAPLSGFSGKSCFGCSPPQRRQEGPSSFDVCPFCPTGPSHCEGPFGPPPFFPTSSVPSPPGLQSSLFFTRFDSGCTELFWRWIWGWSVCLPPLHLPHSVLALNRIPSSTRCVPLSTCSRQAKPQLFYALCSLGGFPSPCPNPRAV
jgi:hypothetical protein